MTNAQEILDHYRERITSLAYHEINDQALQSIEAWSGDVMQLAAEAADEWRAEHLNPLGITDELWTDTYKPALLWRFLHNLAAEVQKAADGWEELFWSGLDERYGKKRRPHG